MGNKIQRIIYCEQKYLSSIPEENRESLDSKLPVLAVSDDVVPDMKGKFSFLYFSRPDFEHSIRELTPEQVSEVFLKRNEYWSPEAANHSKKWLEAEIRKSLKMTVAVLKDCDKPEEIEHLEQNFEDKINCLSLLKGSPPLGLLTLNETLIVALEHEARLYNEYNELQVENGATLAENRKKRAGKLGEILAEHDMDIFLKSMPSVARMRGVNVSQLDPSIKSALIYEGGFVVDWNGGSVIPWSADQLDELQGEGIDIHVLYF
jgi:hypothetical protein